MKLTDDGLTLQMLKDPLNLQKVVLDDVSSRLTGDKVIVDPNQVSVLLIEMASNLTSNLAKATEDTLSSWLPKRAKTSSELYKHMSDYDYVDMFASPASAKIKLILDKNYLINKSLNYNENYKLVVIPKETVFKLGTLDFGIYYPINIRINRHTKYVTVVWDTTEENPLYTLNTNILSSNTFSYMGMELLQIEIPVYQFTRTRVTDNIVPSTGFAKKLGYKDRFYAARFFTNQTGSSELVELHQELGKESYDPSVPTVRMKVLLDENMLSVNIPQIYVTNNKVGSKLYADIYTTKGDINPSIGSLDPSQLKFYFNITSESSDYSKILSNIPTGYISVISDKADGGSNGLTFEEWRNRVVNNSFHTTALITPIDLENYFSDKGFRVVKYKDNLTNLIYFAYKILRDDDGTVIPASNVAVELTETSYKDCSSITKNADGTLTVLPTTLYKYDSSTLSCTPITDQEKKQLSELSKEDQIELFNSTTYTKSPFHFRLIPDGRYSYVSSYNLMNPTVDNFRFNFENDSITAQMTLSGAAITHKDDGSGGYLLRLSCQQSQDLYAVREQDIVVYVYTQDIDGVYIGAKATSVSYSNGFAFYDVTIGTNYHITKDHKLAVTTLSNNTEYTHYIDMNQKYYVSFMVDSDYFPEAITDQSEYIGIPSEYQNNYMVMIRQEFTVNLGYALDDVIYNSINLLWGGEKYQTYQSDVPLTYTTDVYETDEHGVPIYSIVNNKIQFNKIHSVGDIVKNDDGSIIYKYRKGEIIRDANGKGILEEERVLKYQIQALMIDAKIYMSEYPTAINYRTNLTKNLESYFETIRIATDNLLERDLIYFKPVRTLGSGQYSIGDGITVMNPLELSVKFKIYLDPEAYANTELRESIKSQIVSDIESSLENKQISLTDMSNIFKEKISHIQAIDVLGINGDIDLQTLTIADDSVQPSLKQELYLTEDNQINIRKAVDIIFVQSSTI